ncbi:hypothetical protein MGYG_01562 [Nannizzia gypsea CBS 118893]|uniref:Uncharacterized protein n=1 Tax=Arthroderma gypseum (strain ATCC MYA-4604 / CBS 118893) TaxID=535722 RepID=E5R1J9_ARTGP|nr:hypothetical protein MGYG_01562 [Nannizzia gypsea CBS 118893]EFQ98535.1 hypothetical protein MGYG_01562 [Nannizzia gypsea CBS 118893]
MAPQKRHAEESLASCSKQAKMQRDTEEQEDIPMGEGLDINTELSRSDHPSSSIHRAVRRPEKEDREAKDAQIIEDLDTMKLIFQEAARYASSVAKTEPNEREPFKDTQVCSMLAACPEKLLSKIYALREIVTGHAGRHSMLIEDMKFCEEVCNILTRGE